jgi:hypothetical protein
LAAPFGSNGKLDPVRKDAFKSNFPAARIASRGGALGCRAPKSLLDLSSFERGLGHFVSARRGADFNAPRLQGFRDPANQVDLRPVALEGALDLDLIGEAPHDVVGRIVPKISVTPVGQERAPQGRDVALPPSGAAPGRSLAVRVKAPIGLDGVAPGA